MEKALSEARLFDGSVLDGESRIIVVEAEKAGAGRKQWLGLLAAERESAFLLDADFETGGLWAGVSQLLNGFFGELRSHHPELVKRHAAALAYVLPGLKGELGVRNQSLTDLVPDEEKVRAYPADRAYRVVHDLIDLLEELKKAGAAESRWLIVCDNFDRASHIGRRFFVELMRRRGRSMDLQFLVAVDPGAAEGASALFGGAALHVRQELEETPADAIDREDLLREAAALEKQVGGDRNLIEVHVAELLRLYALAEVPAKVFYWKCRALEVYTVLGFYEDALVYGYDAWCNADRPKLDFQVTWILFLKLLSANVGLQRAEEVLKLTEESRLLEHPELSLQQRAKLYYLLSMIYVRYLRPRDLARGEEYLELGLADIHAAKPELTDDQYHFMVVFNRNGLALVRHFQGRFPEAIELCQQGFAQLEEKLPGDKHKLHRSVLMYNIGQVYSAIGDAPLAIDYYSRAMAMDPGYSEYYNERAGLYLRVGDYAAAKNDFFRAIELSPPYPEVWTNLGQCHRKLGEWQDAAAAYTKALDLDPGNVLAVVGRGQVFDALDRIDEAFADYSRALEISPGQWDVHTSRAVLHYQRGDLAASLADLDRAIVLSPEQPDPYLNRSVALEELARIEEAAADLRSYLRLAPEAPDRAEAEQRLRGMTIAA